MTKRLSIFLAIVTIAGCGLSDYESRMAATLTELQEKTRYESLYGPTVIDALVGEGESAEVVEYPISIRLPRAFGASDWFRPGSEYRHRRDTVDPRVLLPPFLGEFPGINRAGENYAEAEQRHFLAYYCYLGVLESRTVKFEKVLADLRKKTAAKIKDTGPWLDVECRDEHLQPTAWKMFEAKGTQLFPDRSDRFTDMPGTFRVFAREERGYIVVWAVRVPDAIAQKVMLLDIADAVAGTVKITAAAPTEPISPVPAKTPAGDSAADTPTETPAEPPAEAPAESPGSEPPKDKAAADSGADSAAAPGDAAEPASDAEPQR